MDLNQRESKYVIMENEDTIIKENLNIIIIDKLKCVLTQSCIGAWDDHADNALACMVPRKRNQTHY